MTPKTIADKLSAKFGDKIVASDVEALDPFCQVAPEAIAEVCSFCRDELELDFLHNLTGVDYMDKKKTTDELGVVYNLTSSAHPKCWFTLIVRLPREAPSLPSVEDIWRTADWHEREAWDLLGIVFEGHHNLTRILCAEDWEGHALRKDYVSPEYYHGIKNNVV